MSSELPYGLQLVSNSSYLWIVDKNGWGVLTEGNNASNDKLTVKIDKLNKFFVSKESLYVECLQGNGDIVYILVRPSSEDSLLFDTQIFIKNEFLDFLSASTRVDYSEIKWEKFHLSIFERIGM